MKKNNLSGFDEIFSGTPRMRAAEFAPQKEEKEKRTAKLQVLVTPKLRSEIETRARKAGLTKSDYVYQLLLHHVGWE